MEQRGERRRKDYRGTIQSKSISYFPNDLTAEILSWLPKKSVARLSCVSKLWSSITTDPYFINLWKTRSQRESLLLCLTHGNDLFVASIPQHTKSSNNIYYSSQAPIHRYHMKLSGVYYPYGMELVHGLVCFTKSRPPVVLNPTTRQFLTLPKPDITSTYMVFFGYDPIEGKHKVMCLRYEEICYGCRVLTMGSGQESWRTVRTTKHQCGYSPGRCIKGVIYYLASSKRPGFHRVIMSFDVRSEKFHMIKLPSGIAWDLMITYKGRLACTDRNNKTRLWISEDAKKHKWSFQDFLSPFGYSDPSLRVETDFKLKGFSHAGEFVYVPYRFHNSSYILFYDPVRNSCRRFKFEEIFEDKSVHYNGSLYWLDAFPNHIESQLSL